MKSATQLQACLLLFASVILTNCGGGGSGDGSSPGTVSGGDLGLSIVKDPQPGAPSSLVSVSFFVADGNKEPLPGLSAGDFEILENGEPNSTFESSKRILRDPQEFGVYTMLLLDLSDSILRSGSRPELVNAAKAFATSVFTSDDAGFHRMGVYWFDGSQSIHAMFDADHFTSNLEEVIEALDTLPQSFDPSTNLFGATVEGIQLVDEILADAEDIAEGNLVIFTDGNDTAGRATLADVEHVQNQLVHTAGQEDGKHIHSYAIGLGGELDRETLSRIGRSRTLFARFVFDLEAVFKRIGQRISDRAGSFYKLEYCSPKRAGAHSLTIKAVHKGDEGFLQTQFDATGFTASCDVEFVEFDVDAVSGPDDDQASAVAVATNGDRYVAGTFQGDISLGAFNSHSAGPSAGFVAQTATEGTPGITWSRSYSAPDTRVHVEDLTLSGSNELPTICGSVVGSLAALGTSGSSPTPVGYVSQLAIGGDPLWTRTITGGTSAHVVDVTSLKIGNDHFVAIAGHFEGSVRFQDSNSSRVLTSLSDTDGFIALYSAAEGRLQWASRVGSTGEDQVLGVAASGDGGLFATGFVSAAVTDDGPGTSSPHYPTGFVTKVNRAGSRTWIHALSDPEGVAGFIDGSSRGTSIDTDAENSIFIGGVLHGKTACHDDEGPITEGDSTPPNQDAFVAKFDRNGEIENGWCRAMGSRLDDDITSLAVDTNGDVTVVGTFRDTANLGGPIFTASGGDLDDALAIRLSGYSGRNLFAYTFGGLNTDRALGVAVDADDITYVVGFFNGSASFIGREIHAEESGADGFVLTIR